MDQKIDRMKELVDKLNEASRVYYQGKDEIMSNIEYDKLYDELQTLEEETGTVMNNSPTIHVGYETLSELPKEAHITPMLSLGKTKEVSQLQQWLGEHEGMLSLKLDGLSVILTYEGGQLVKALTRGNGEVGDLITNNARTFENIPSRISYKGRVVVRGEALIKYSDFDRMNREIMEVAEQYKNPRNLCSGSVRQLNNEITAKRHVNFFVYNLIQTDDDTVYEKKEQQLLWLKKLGFDIVPYEKVRQETLTGAVDRFSQLVGKGDLPSDGLVLTFDDIAYSQSLGRTAKFPRDSIAFKWKDELAETTLQEIEWSASRTGLINPVAVFEPVELEGTTVSRASVHNVSIVRELKLGTGDHISVYKANMIIPQIYENQTKSDTCLPPEKCPVCQGKTRLITENESTVLYCENPECYAKKIKSFSHFVSRDAMNVDGLSESTLEKIINKNLLHSILDLYRLKDHRDVLVKMDGFGEKSFENLVSSIEQSKQVPLANALYALGIKGIGLSTAKLIAKQFPGPLQDFEKLCVEDLLSIDGIGQVLADSFVTFFASEEIKKQVADLDEILEIEMPEVDETAQLLQGQTFVITGSLQFYPNRNACKEEIERLGGKVAGSVSSKTTYLVNNDVASQSSKNRKAKELGIPIISEEELRSILSR